MSGLALIATVVLLRADGAVLLQHRDDKPGLSRANQWVTPGGHIAAGEAPREAARREFFEETGYQCTTLNPLTPYPDCDGVRHFILYPFWEWYDGKQEIQCYEGQAVLFTTVEERHLRAMPDIVATVWDAAWRAASQDAGAR